MLKSEIYRILADLRSDLEDFESIEEGCQTWEETVECAINDAWDRLGKIENPVE